MPELVEERGGKITFLTTDSARENDGRVMRAVARGDRAAFERVYEAHRPRIHRLAYGILLDRDEAREAVQEAFSRLYGIAPRWEPNAAIGTWLHRVVLNHCLSLRRRLFRFGRSPLPAGQKPSPELEATLGQAVVVVERNLARLPPRTRALLTLHLEGERKPGEIGPLVGMTANATRVALHRALADLRADLEASGIDATPADPTMPDEPLSRFEEEM